MQRKLIKQGQRSCTVSLPIKWINRYNLQPGDEVTIAEKGQSLIISGQGTDTKQVELNVPTTHKEFLRTVLSSYYRQGLDSVILHFPGQLPYNTIYEIVGSLTGYEIVQETATSCTIQNVMHEEQRSSQLVSTLFFKINILFDLMKKQVTTQKGIPELGAVRQSILKIRDQCQRQIIKENSLHEHELYSFVLTLEKIAGEYFFLTKMVSEMKNKDVQLLEQYHDLLQEIKTSFLARTFRNTHPLYQKISNMSKAERADQRHSMLVQKGHDITVVVTVSKILHHVRTLASRLQNVTGLSQGM